MSFLSVFVLIKNESYTTVPPETTEFINFTYDGSFNTKRYVGSFINGEAIGSSSIETAQFEAIRT
ncbi:MAG: hypothetical protein K0S55_1182 [Clostridia bacterium]|nr:hypothetical protein [Clostridia bacterium]